jgi:glycolate oxidase FAD binding subunit
MNRPWRATFPRLEFIAGAGYVATDDAELAAHEVCGVRPTAVVRPANAAEVSDVVRFAVSQKLAVIPMAGATKVSIGLPPSRFDIAINLSRMNRVLAYDPQDLTLGVEPGVRIEDLTRVLAEKKQFLPLVVPFSDRATIGGIVAANASSPLRHAYGGARDFCLGMEFITGEGVQAKSGGRVVKNVTGYDLHKLLIGSLGTLGVITRLNFRTFPMPQTQGTFVASFPSPEPAFAYCNAVAHSVLAPQMLEVADPGACRLIFSAKSSMRILPMHWSVILTAAGQPAVVERYARELGHIAAAANAAEFLQLNDGEQFSAFRRIREFPRLLLGAAPDAAIFRIGVLPGGMASLLDALSEIAKRFKVELITLTRASGIVYAAFFAQSGNGVPSGATTTAVREAFHVCALPKTGAQAMLEWCPAEMKRMGVDPWGPWRDDFALMRRVKNAFDPQNVLAPGRFAGGI